jgi:hypothetical protein
MRREWLLVAVGVLVLCIVGIVPVLAQGRGPGGNPIYATIEYVDQIVGDVYEYIDQQIAAVYAYVDEQIGGGGGVAAPAWQLAEGYEVDWDGEQLWLRPVPQGCISTELGPTIWIHGEVYGIAHLTDTDNVVRGMCDLLAISYVDTPDDLPVDGFEMELWFSWMGETKKATYTVSPPYLP